jgi:hypothetical protein
MYIKNRRNSSKIKGFGSYQILCLTGSLVLRNRLLFIYPSVSGNAKKHHVPTLTVDNLTIIITDFTNILSIFELNNLTDNK